MPVLTVEKDGLSAFNAAATPQGDPRGRIPTFFFDTNGRGTPRFDDLITVRALEQTHTVTIPIDTIKTQISTTDWVIRPTVDNPTSRHEEAAADLTAWLDGNYNANKDSFDHLVKQWANDLLSMDAGILELVPREEPHPEGGQFLDSIWPRDGATFVKAPKDNGVLPDPEQVDPDAERRDGVPAWAAYWQFPLSRQHRPWTQEEPMHEFQEAFERLRFYGHKQHEPIPFPRDHIVWTQESPYTWRPYGLGRVQKAKRIIEIILNQDITNRRYFTGNEIPEGVLNLVQASQPELERFREWWEDEVEGREHKLPIVGGREMEWTRFRPELKDLQFLESQEWYHKLVWFLFGLNQAEIGDVADVNRATAKEQGHVVYRQTTKPLLDNLAADLNTQILPRTEPYARVDGELEFAWQPDHPHVKAKMRSRQQEDLNHGVRTVNEVRQERGLDEVPWGDMPAELRKSIARVQPEWAMEAWGVTPEDVLPPASQGGGGSGFRLGSPRPATKNPEGVPDDAIPIGSEDQAPPGADIHEGPDGGIYYTPGASDEGSTEGDGPEDVESVADNLEDHLEEKEFVDDFGVYDFFSAQAPYREDFEPPDTMRHEAAEAFAGDPSNEETAPMWAHVASETENFNVHPDLSQEAGDADLSPEDENRLEQHKELTHEMVRRTDPTYDEETDTIEVYRGVNGDFARQLAQGVRDEGEVEVEHRTVESWTADPNLARAFAGTGAGAIVRKRVPVESIQTSFQSNPSMWAGDQAEAEYVVAAPPEGFTYSRDEVLEASDLEDQAEVEELAEQRADEWRDKMEEFR